MPKAPASVAIELAWTKTKERLMARTNTREAAKERVMRDESFID